MIFHSPEKLARTLRKSLRSLENIFVCLRESCDILALLNKNKLITLRAYWCPWRDTDPNWSHQIFDYAAKWMYTCDALITLNANPLVAGNLREGKSKHWALFITHLALRFAPYVCSLAQLAKHSLMKRHFPLLGSVIIFLHICKTHPKESWNGSSPTLKHIIFKFN